MALQSSGAISLANVQTEFGGSNPISISEYYDSDTGVPASGTISLSDFYGTSSFPPVVTSGLQLLLDPGNSNSYPGSGTTYSDLSPNGNDGTITFNNITYDANTNGGVFNFPATTPAGYISFGTTPTNIQGVVDNLTMQAYVKPDPTWTSKTIFGADGGGNGLKTPHIHRIDNNRVKYITNQANSGVRSITGSYLGGTTPPWGDWIHTTVTVSAAYWVTDPWPPVSYVTVKFYLNGSLTHTQSTYEPGAPESGIEYRIGMNEGGGNIFTGLMGPILFYNRVLSDAEIVANYDVFKSRYGLT